MILYDKMSSVLKTLDIGLIDSLIKRGYLKLDLDDLSVTFHDTFLTQELIDEVQKYLYFAFCTLYLVKNHPYLFLEPEEGTADLMRELLALSTHDFENSPKQAINKYFYQHEREISDSGCKVRDTEPYWAYSYKSILIIHCTAEKGLDIQLGVVKKVNFSVHMSDIPGVTVTDIREEDFYGMNVPFFCYIVKSNAILSIDNAFNLHLELSLITENSSVTIHEDFTGATREYCKTLTDTLLNRSIYVTQPFLPSVNSSYNRYQSNPNLVRNVPVSPLSEIRSWVSGPQPFVHPTVTPSNEDDFHNLLMETDDFIGFVNIGVKAEDCPDLKKLSDRSIGKFLIGHTYIIDNRDASWYTYAGGCNIEIFVQSKPISIAHSKLTSIEESSGMSIIISTKKSGYDVQSLLGSGFILYNTVQKIVEYTPVKELIRDLNNLLGEGKYYLTLLCLNKNQLLDEEARSSFKEKLMDNIIQDLQYTSVSYSLEPLLED